MSEADFFEFINERNAIYLRKRDGLPKPWTNDPILQQWKFCNIFRQLDTTTEWLIKNVIEPHQDDDPSLLMFNIFAFRAYNLIATYKYLGGWIKGNYNSQVEENELERFVLKGNRLISGAYMIRGYKGQAKWQSIPETLEKIYESKDTLYKAIISERNIQNAVTSIVKARYWGWAEFTAYQVTLDLTYTPILKNPPDLNTWCVIGPGAAKGLRYIYQDLPKKQMLSQTRLLLDLSPHYIDLDTPELTLQDIEFALCEYGKYMRIKEGGRGKHRYAGV